MLVLQECAYCDIMVLCHSKNGFVQIALQNLCYSEINIPGFKMNISNLFYKEFILDAIEVLQRSTEIKNCIFIEGIRNHMVMNNSKALHGLSTWYQHVTNLL